MATVSARELTERPAEVAGVPAGKFEQMTPTEFDQIAAADPIMAEVREMLYLFHHPLILTPLTPGRRSNLKPTALEDVLSEMVTGAN